jgi:hypothetical protein
VTPAPGARSWVNAATEGEKAITLTHVRALTRSAPRHHPFVLITCSACGTLHAEDRTVSFCNALAQRI